MSYFEIEEVDSEWPLPILRERNRTSFAKGVTRSPESVEKQRRTIQGKIDRGEWVSHAPLGPNLRKSLPGSRNGKWVPVGSRSVQKNGYVKVKIGEPSEWLYEHRHVAQQMLGRALTKDEEVHHVNGQRDDNRRSNLVVLPKHLHAREKFPRCPECGYIHPPH